MLVNCVVKRYVAVRSHGACSRTFQADIIAFRPAWLLLAARYTVTGDAVVAASAQWSYTSQAYCSMCLAWHGAQCSQLPHPVAIIDVVVDYTVM